MRIRTIHQAVTISGERHPAPLRFAPAGDGFFEGEVPDAVGEFLLSIARPNEYVRVDSVRQDGGSGGSYSELERRAIEASAAAAREGRVLERGVPPGAPDAEVPVAAMASATTASESDGTPQPPGSDQAPADGTEPGHPAEDGAPVPLGSGEEGQAAEEALDDEEEDDDRADAAATAAPRAKGRRRKK